MTRLCHSLDLIPSRWWGSKGSELGVWEGFCRFCGAVSLSPGCVLTLPPPTLLHVIHSMLAILRVPFAVLPNIHDVVCCGWIRSHSSVCSFSCSAFLTPWVVTVAGPCLFGPWCVAIFVVYMAIFLFLPFPLAVRESTLSNEPKGTPGFSLGDFSVQVV